MTENPLQSFLNTSNKLLRCADFHLHRLFAAAGSNFWRASGGGEGSPLSLAVESHSNAVSPVTARVEVDLTDVSHPLKGKSAVTPLTKEELGKATWTLLHTIAAQYPDEPTRQQKRDVKELMSILSRLYPCKECADHFKEILKTTPVQAGSQAEFSQWLCHVHNIVNRSLGKVKFPCQRVNARWGKLDCKDRSCDVQGTTEHSFVHRTS